MILEIAWGTVRVMFYVFLAVVLLKATLVVLFAKKIEIGKKDGFSKQCQRCPLMAQFSTGQGPK